MAKHLVWDWNGTLLDDLWLVVAATNATLASAAGPSITADEHRRDFCRPISAYYAHVLGRPVDEAEFARLDRVFHEAYRSGLAECGLTADAAAALSAWPGTQSLLSMYFHTDLVPVIDAYGLTTHFVRVDGLRDGIGGGAKAEHLVAHLEAVGVTGSDCVLIGDSVDDAAAAAAVGARCVLYSGGFTDPKKLRTVGVPVADSLTEAVEIAGRPRM